MKVQHLGKLTELPPVPAGVAASLLIIENRDQASNLILKSAVDDNEDKDVWFDLETFDVTTTEDIAEHWPDGFEAVLITFEPTDS
jgi:hypothetical protein